MKKLLELLSAALNRPHIQEPKKETTEPEAEPQPSPIAYKLVFNCNQKDIDHLDGLVRYYETRYEGVISRGLWLLTLMRDTEVESKRLAIIEIDEESGLVTYVSPISLA